MTDSKLRWCHEFTWLKCDCPEGKCSKSEQEFPQIPWHRVKAEAKDLFDSFYDVTGLTKEAIKCALIAVDKLIYYSQAHGLTTLTKFYEEVSKQLQTYH